MESRITDEDAKAHKPKVNSEVLHEVLNRFNQTIKNPEAFLLAAIILRDHNKIKNQNDENLIYKEINSLTFSDNETDDKNLKNRLLLTLEEIKLLDQVVLDDNLNQHQREQYLTHYNSVINLCMDVNTQDPVFSKHKWGVEIKNTILKNKAEGNPRRKFLKKIGSLMLHEGISLVLSKVGIRYYNQQVDQGKINSEEGMLLANLESLNNISTEDLQIEDKERWRLSKSLAGRIAPGETKEQENIAKWLHESGLEGIANTAKILMLTNSEILSRHGKSISSFLENEYLPQIEQLGKDLRIPTMALFQFLEYNGAGTYAQTLNIDTQDLKIQTIFGAINTLVAKRLKIDSVSDLITFAGYRMPDAYMQNQSIGAYNAIRALSPTGTPIGLEYTAIARGIVELLNDKKFGGKIISAAPDLVRQCSNLVEAENNFESQHLNLVKSVNEYLENMSEAEILKDWAKIFENKDHDLWKNIGIGDKTTNIPGILYQLTNFTIAWECLVITNHQDLSSEHLNECLILARDEIISQYYINGYKIGIKKLFYDQIKNPAFRKEIESKINKNNNKHLSLIIEEYNKLDDLVIPFRNELAKAQFEFSQTQFIPEVLMLSSVGTAKWLDQLSNKKEELPTLYKFRNDPYCRSFFLLTCREISEVNGGLVPDEGVRFRDVNMPLQSLDHGLSTLKKLDKLMSTINNKVNNYYDKTSNQQGRIVLDIASKIMSNRFSPELRWCFQTDSEYNEWVKLNLIPQVDKLLGWFAWSGTHLALSRYIAING